MIQAWGITAVWIAWLLLLPVACWSTLIVLPQEADTDPAWIVVDEWLGQWLSLIIALLILPVNGPTFVFAFLTFRFFDILKPWPIRKLEHTGPGWWAIHADDLLAGVYTGITMLALHMLVGRFGLAAPT